MGEGSKGGHLYPIPIVGKGRGGKKRRTPDVSLPSTQLYCPAQAHPTTTPYYVRRTATTSLASRYTTTAAARAPPPRVLPGLAHLHTTALLYLAFIRGRVPRPLASRIWHLPARQSPPSLYSPRHSHCVCPSVVSSSPETDIAELPLKDPAGRTRWPSWFQEALAD